MKRKVIQISGNTLMVSLPASWARKFNVKKGDELELELADAQLILSPTQAKGTEKAKVDISRTQPMTKRVLGALYKSGYDEAEVHFSTPEEFDIVKDVIDKEFIGFEITSQGDTRLTMKRVSTVEMEEFDSILRRMFHSINHMAKETLSAVKTNDKDKLRRASLIDLDVNKLADFCRRILNKHGYVLFRRTPPLYFIVEQLEKVGDIYRDICKERITHKSKPLSKEELKLFEEVNQFFRHFQEVFYAFSLKDMTTFGKKRYELRDKFNSMLKEGKHDNLLISHLLNIEECTFDMNGPLMAARL